MRYQGFLSIVLPMRNQSKNIEKILVDIGSYLSVLVNDYEIIVVDNASNDDSVYVLKNLTGEMGQPNLQVYALSNAVDLEMAAWVGIENALGDFVAIFDPLVDDINFLPRMLDKVVSGADLVFANNEKKPIQNLIYRCAYIIFSKLHKLFNGIDITKESSNYRVLSRRVINFICQHQYPAIAYRLLPTTGGFIRVNLQYSSPPKVLGTKKLWQDINRGMWILVSANSAPLRAVTIFTLFGALANIAYSIYVIVIALTKSGIAAGWASISIQQSGMFFLISLVLFVLSEYVLQMLGVVSSRPVYHVQQEFTSAHMTRREKLNIEESI